MRCHYIYDKGVGRVFIPGCWAGTIHANCNNPLDFCTCSPGGEKVFVRREENKQIRELKQRVSDLEKENKYLADQCSDQSRIILKLLKKINK